MQIRQRPVSATPRFSAALHPALERVLAARGVLDDAQLQLSLQGLLPPEGLAGLDAAVELLWQSLQAQKKLLVVADYDADGATSCALALLGLRALGFRHVDYLVPNRFDYGYGLTPPIVELAAERAPHLLITVDNGIASHAGVECARRLGMEVLITDHHLPAETLPAASAIVNPNQPGCGFASKALAGVGVVFYLLSALRRTLRQRQWFSSQGLAEPNLASWLDLVALGTVADVAALDDNNRRLVRHGLQLIRQRRCRPGILALLDCAGRASSLCRASDLGFAIGPRLNAAGRLDDMRLGIECLLTDDAEQARRMAVELDTLNQDRRQIERSMQETAQQHLAHIATTAERRQSLCLYDPGWHQGVIGILASRLKERLHCPVVIFADGGLDADGVLQLKGSARSIAGIHIRDVLDAVATRHAGLLDKFGGHAMAAGLTLTASRFTAFAAAFDAEVRALADPELFERCHYSDGTLEPACLSLEFALQVRDLLPWGQQCPEPLFENEFTILGHRVLAERHLKFTLSAAGAGDRGAGGRIEAIAFNAPPELLQPRSQRVRLLYKLDINDYRGDLTPQLLIEQFDYV
jgi:single-stranded-DNA-specific exonuclease